MLDHLYSTLAELDTKQSNSQRISCDDSRFSQFVDFKRKHAITHLPNQIELREALTSREALSGDHMVVETPVPIPNTAVKHNQPMIVPTSAKVGIAGFI